MLGLHPNLWRWLLLKWLVHFYKHTLVCDVCGGNVSGHGWLADFMQDVYVRGRCTNLWLHKDDQLPVPSPPSLHWLSSLLRRGHAGVDAERPQAH